MFKLLSALPSGSRLVPAGQRTEPLVTTTVIEPAPRACQNCQTPMHGPYCYQCGQHEKSSLRHLGLLLRDILDDVLNLDSRAVRTLKPLLLRPGFLTIEYFAGRRQRYVPPLRLYVIASLVFFLIASLAFSLDKELAVFDVEADPAKKEQVQQEVQQDLSEAMEDPEFRAAMAEMPPAVRQQIHDASGVQLPTVTPPTPTVPTEPNTSPVSSATEATGTVEPRTVESGTAESGTVKPVTIKHATAMPATAKPAAEKSAAPDPASVTDLPAPGTEEATIRSKSNLAANLSFLPNSASAWLRSIETQLDQKSEEVGKDPRRLIQLVLSVLPQSMFVLLPLFALLLKVCYPFANRFYMEHLVVALHSHSFMYLLFVLLIAANYGVAELNMATGEHPAITGLLGTVTGLLLGIGVPLYLYLMQKRVYGQPHLMTVFKFLVVGIVYMLLLSLVIAVDVVVSMLKM